MQVLAFILVLFFSTPLFAQQPAAVIAEYQSNSSARLELYEDGTADITVPGWDDIFSFDFIVAEVLPDGRACLANDTTSTSEPSIWVYLAGTAAEIHLPLIGAVFVAGNEGDMSKYTRPNCATKYEKLHKLAVAPKKQLD